MIQTDTGPQQLTWSQVKDRKKRREATFTLVTDDEAATAYRLAKARRDDLPFGATADDRAAAQAAVDDAERAVRASALTMRLRAMPRKGDGSFDALKAEHPPTEDDNKSVQQSSGNAKAKALWHADTFYPALVAASLTEPKVTVEEAAEMAADWNDGEWTELYLTALDVNQRKTDTAGLTFS